MIRALFRFLFSAIGILIAAKVVPGIVTGRFLDLLMVAVLLGLIDATLGAFLKVITVVPRACSFGCLTLVINGLLFWLTGYVAQYLGLGFKVTTYWAAFFGALVSSVIAALLEWILVGRDRPNRPQGMDRNRRLKIINGSSRV